MITVRAGQDAAVGQPQPVVAVLSRQALGLAHVQERGAEGPGLPPGLLRQPGAADALGEAGVVADHRAGPGLAADGLMLDDHGPQAFGGRADRGGEPGRARADHRHIEDLPGRDRCHDAEGVGDLGVGGVDQRGPPGREPEHDNRQFRGGQAEFAPASAGRARRWRRKSRPGPGGGRTGHAAPETARTTARRSPAPARSRRRAGCSTPAGTR